MDVENLIGQAAANGWDFFKDIVDGPQKRAGSVSPEQMAKAERLATGWADFYASETGKACVDHLVEITLERASFVSALGLPMDAAYGHGCMREGQNAIVFTVLKMIAEGRKDKAPSERTP